MILMVILLGFFLIFLEFDLDDEEEETFPADEEEE